MKQLRLTTAVTLVLGALTYGAVAQESGQDAAAAKGQSAAVAGPSYCDTPWFKVDGNEDGFVSEDEANGAVESAFGSIDADGNGEIGKTEYVDCMTGTGQKAAAAKRDEESFSAADANSDDSISRDEFRDAAEQAYNDSQSASEDDADAWVMLRRYVWLTPDESDDVLQNLSGDEAAARSAMTFAALDEDGDGIVDTREWANSEPTSGRTEEWASARFDKIDDDASGALGKEEYKAAHAAMLDQMSTSATGSTAEDDSSSSSDSASATTDDAAPGVPVYVYRFWTF